MHRSRVEWTRPHSTPMASTTLPELHVRPSPAATEEWRVVVFNNEVNTYEEVMTILMIATGCDAEEAYIETWEVDHYGKCAVHRATQDECDRIAEVIRTIGVTVVTEPAA